MHLFIQIFLLVIFAPVFVLAVDEKTMTYHNSSNLGTRKCQPDAKLETLKTNKLGKTSYGFRALILQKRSLDEFLAIVVMKLLHW